MRSLVMADQETGSLWSHILGEAMAGPLKGTVLTILPSAMTDWKSWKTTHPKTTVVMMSRTSRKFNKEFFRNPSRFVIGYKHNGKTRAWGFDLLQKTPIINDALGEKTVLVTFDVAANAPYLFGREINGKTLTFSQRNGKLVDKETNSEWNRITGKAISGSMKGKQLPPLTGVVSFKRAWQNFHPKSSYAKSGN